jgi:multidrug efflux pump subunit AcrB
LHAPGARVHCFEEGSQNPGGTFELVHDRNDFKSFAIGLSLSIVLLYLILVAQFSSFKDPFLIMLAVPMGIIGF